MTLQRTLQIKKTKRIALRKKKKRTYTTQNTNYSFLKVFVENYQWVVEILGFVLFEYVVEFSQNMIRSLFRTISRSCSMRLWARIEQHPKSPPPINTLPCLISTLKKLKPSANKTNNLARFYNYQQTHTQNTKNEKILKPILWIAYPALIFLTLTIIVLCFIYTTCAHTKQYNYGKREIVSSILSFRSRLSEY